MLNLETGSETWQIKGCSQVQRGIVAYGMWSKLYKPFCGSRGGKLLRLLVELHRGKYRHQVLRREVWKIHGIEKKISLFLLHRFWQFSQMYMRNLECNANSVAYLQCILIFAIIRIWGIHCICSIGGWGINRLGCWLLLGCPAPGCLIWPPESFKSKASRRRWLFHIRSLRVGQDDYRDFDFGVWSIFNVEVDLWKTVKML